MAYPAAMRSHIAPLLALAAAGCAPQVRPAVAPQVVASEWRDAGEVLNATPIAQSLADSLGSTELKRLTARALAANADVGVATARVERARAELKVARGAMLPAISVSAGISDTHTDDKNASVYRYSEGFGGIDISYDFDLFGSARATARAAGRRAQAASFDRNAAALVVEADVARAFVQYCALADRIHILDDNLRDARELERIIGVRVREGASTRLDLGLQTIEVRQLETERSRLVEAQSRTRNALAVLAGEEAPLFSIATADLSGLRIASLRPVQPAELLSRRPDLQASEARIAAASGDVQAARAAFLPSLSLSASGLAQAATLGGPIGTTLAAGSGLIAPIFARGRLKGRLAGAAADQHESVELYRKSLFNALSESQNALAAVDQSARRHALVLDMVDHARTSARLARLQYLEGDADLSELLNAQTRLVGTEDSLAIALQERLDAAIDLYAAMGGTPAS